MNYYDLLLARNLANKGDITTESLSVTENGTYTAPSGKAYTPVTVEVQPPANSYQLKSITTPTSLATFEASAMPMPSLKVSVEAQQDLHGYDKPWVGGAGKNKFDASLLSDVASNIKYVTVTLKANTQYTMSSTIPLQSGNTANLFFMLPSESASSTSNGVSINSPITITTGADGQVKVGYRLGDNTESQYASYHYQIEEGSTVTSYEPYSNICPISGWDNAIVTDTDDVDNPTVTQTTTISLGQTVYGGEVDVVNGELKITDGYIASYNGETLPSTWISSMDVYAEGTTPTIGAEVCYELATPTTFTTQPTPIKSLNGINNLSVDCGEIIEGEYFKAL